MTIATLLWEGVSTPIFLNEGLSANKCWLIKYILFSVPPQQFISQDGGIVEMGAEIQVGLPHPPLIPP